MKAVYSIALFLVIATTWFMQSTPIPADRTPGVEYIDAGDVLARIHAANPVLPLPWPLNDLADRPDNDLVRLQIEVAQRIASGETGPLQPRTKLPPAVRDGQPMLATCFAEGTPDDIMNAVNQALFGDLEGIAYELTTRWSGAQGSPRALTWSFAPDGVTIPSGIGEGSGTNEIFSRMDALFAGQGGRATWISRFQSCFDRWAALTGLSYTRITVGGNDWDDGASWGSAGSAGLRGDIRIGMKNIDGANGVLAYNPFPANGGDMVLDRAEGWGNSTNTHRFLRNTVMHEHGHGVGLLHVCPINNSKLMEPFLNTNFDGPRHDDLRGGQRHYGDVDEANDTTTTATDIGTVNSGSPVTRGTVPAPSITAGSTLGLDANGDVDYFRFTVTQTVTASVTVTPVGMSYTAGPQSGNCTSGTSINSLSIADLAVQIIDSNGVTVLGEASASGIGLAETLSNVNLPVAGDYYLRIYETNSPAAVQLYTFTLSVSGACAAPSITTQPQNQTGCVGGSVTFSVAANGTGPLGYQWRFNSANIPGATSSSYTINPVGDGNAGNYDCVVTNACGSATSNVATLTVNSPVNISTHPVSQTVCSGAGVTFTVVASGSPTLTYQWRRNSANIAGATSAAYTIASANTGHAGTYDCVVTNPCGSVTSNPATLTVNTAPSITTQPQSQSVCSGGSVTFTVAASGGGTLSYQWRRNSTNISGANSSAYTINPVNAGNAGNYDCVVTNACGTTTSNVAVLTVNTAPTITTHPQSQSVCGGDSVTFTVAASGAGTLSYQWRFNSGNIPGANSSSYTINPVSGGNAGDYDCIVTNACGSTTSNIAVLTVSAGPQISQQPQSQTVCTGGVATFSVVASGQGTLTYQWRFNGGNIPGASSSSYTINPVNAGNAGDYDCVIGSSCGSITSAAATLTVGANTITQQPQSQTVCEGQPASFTVVAGGTPAPTYQWRRNTVNIPGANSATFAIAAVTSGDAGTYDCVLTNQCGSVTSEPATLTIGAGQSITQPPQSLSNICQGSQATFTVTAPGATSYQWRFNGLPIPGATGSAHVIAAVTPADAGSYDVICTGPCGSSTSAPATLTVQRTGDSNCDGAVNNFDIDPFVIALSSGQAAWEALFSCNYLCANDINRDGNVNNFDIDPFVQLLTQ
jgi:hypothetical protein